MGNTRTNYWLLTWFSGNTCVSLHNAIIRRQLHFQRFLRLIVTSDAITSIICFLLQNRLVSMKPTLIEKANWVYEIYETEKVNLRAWRLGIRKWKWCWKCWDWRCRRHVRVTWSVRRGGPQVTRPEWINKPSPTPCYRSKLPPGSFWGKFPDEAILHYLGVPQIMKLITLKLN